MIDKIGHALRRCAKDAKDMWNNYMNSCIIFIEGGKVCLKCEGKKITSFEVEEYVNKDIKIVYVYRRGRLHVYRERMGFKTPSVYGRKVQTGIICRDPYPSDSEEVKVFNNFIGRLANAVCDCKNKDMQELLKNKRKILKKEFENNKIDVVICR